MKNSLLVAACATLTMGRAFALNCGDTVSGVVNLTADLNCTAQDGLHVGASNTTINLNGFSINCTGAGFGGSCQTAVGQPVGGPKGIMSVLHKNVTVKGPGTIKGFAYNVMLLNGTGFRVEEVNFTGPPSALANSRLYAGGAVISGAPCLNSVLGADSTPSVFVLNNQFENQSQAIQLTGVGCAVVAGNTVHHNNNALGDSHGILLYNVENSSVYRNTLTGVGLNQNSDAAVMIHAGSSHNKVYGNVVISNCATGIWMAFQSNKNNVYANTVKFNGTSSFDGRCNIPQQGQFVDLLEFLAGPGNIWNNNNVCHTQGGTVPAGVCNPNE